MVSDESAAAAVTRSADEDQNLDGPLLHETRDLRLAPKIKGILVLHQLVLLADLKVDANKDEGYHHPDSAGTPQGSSRL